VLKNLFWFFIIPCLILVILSFQDVIAGHVHFTQYVILGRDMNKNIDKEKTEPGVSSAVTPDGSVANKFSSPPTGNILPVGYKSRLYPCSGIAPSADTFNPEAASFPLPGSVATPTAC
jgi:hypothetical protein